MTVAARSLAALPARTNRATLAPKPWSDDVAAHPRHRGPFLDPIGFSTYVPFYYLEVLKGDPHMVGTLLAVFLGAGAAGTLIAGPISDRIGHRRYMVGVFFLATPLAVGFMLASAS